MLTLTNKAQLARLLVATGLDQVSNDPDQSNAPLIPLPQQIAAVAGTDTEDADGLPTTVGGLRSLIRTLMGQAQIPTGTTWPMSLNRSATRLNLLEPRVALLEQRLEQVADGLDATDAEVEATVARLELLRAALATSDAQQAADAVRLAAVEAKATLTASATEANRLEIAKNTAADALRDAHLSQDATAIAAAQATATQARAEASLAQKKAEYDAAALLVLQAQLTTVQQAAAANATNLASVATDVATRLPASAVQRFTVNLPAVTIQVLTPYAQVVTLPKPFPNANYLVFLDKASGGLLNTELGDKDKTAGTFTLTARNTGAVSLAMPAGVAEVLAILIS